MLIKWQINLNAVYFRINRSKTKTRIMWLTQILLSPGTFSQQEWTGGNEVCGLCVKLFRRRLTLHMHWAVSCYSGLRLERCWQVWFTDFVDLRLFWRHHASACCNIQFRYLARWRSIYFLVNYFLILCNWMFSSFLFTCQVWSR